MSECLLVADGLFDGVELHARPTAVLVRDGLIAGVGAEGDFGDSDERPRVRLPGTTLLPGLIDLHTHLLLHPYAEVSAGDQVLRESLALRIVRAAVAARATLAAGFTTIRDLGSEGAGAADAGLRDAFALGIAPGPRMFVATRAIVATGTYLPRGFAPEVCACIPQAAQEADGVEALRRVAREQIRAGADWLKVYADFPYGPGARERPAFSIEELRTVAEIAHDAGCLIAAHATTPEGMRRATLAGCDTIEHGTGGTPAVFALMAQHGTVLCPTLAANDALARLRDKPERVTQARAAMMHAMQAGVTIACGSDAGPYPHGENATELALLVDYGMAPLEALRAATSRAADVLRRPDLGRLEAGARADIVAVEGDLAGDLRALRDVRFVMQNGRPID